MEIRGRVATKLEFLVDHPEFVPQVIQWWQAVWADRMGPDIEKSTRQLRESRSKDALPIHLLASVNGKLVGTAALKLKEITELYPDNHYWLGSVFVAELWRGDNIASMMSMGAVALARARNLPRQDLPQHAQAGKLEEWRRDVRLWPLGPAASSCDEDGVSLEQWAGLYRRHRHGTWAHREDPRRLQPDRTRWPHARGEGSATVDFVRTYGIGGRSVRAGAGQ